jgi:beta-glucanase (GH16 family)
MRKTYIFLLAIIGLSIGCAKKVQTPQIETGPKLIWSDEFDYTGLPNANKWGYDVGGNGWGNNELQYYTQNEIKNTSVANGVLTITAIKEPVFNNQYSSARLITKGKMDMQYGKIEIRAKLPAGKGSWPALWMLASKNGFTWPDDGEVDIMEHVGYDFGRVHASVHTKSFNHMINTQKTANIMVPDCATSFHVYTMEWDSKKITIAVDGRSYFTFTDDGLGYNSWPFANSMHLLMNIAVGGNWGGAQGIDETIFPIKMEVDYVRVYE